MGGVDDPMRDVDHETRLSGALGFGSNIGVTIGASYTDYGIGRAITATLAPRWGARV